MLTVLGAAPACALGLPLVWPTTWAWVRGPAAGGSGGRVSQAHVWQDFIASQPQADLGWSGLCLRGSGGRSPKESRRLILRQWLVLWDFITSQPEPRPDLSQSPGREFLAGEMPWESGGLILG